MDVVHWPQPPEGEKTIRKRCLAWKGRRVNWARCKVQVAARDGTSIGASD